ncbi:hypothetical protein CLAVI_000912 [Candidatus Clavichlamydia salmonicola]|uniref:hypothetical protein n=1 Tax=Candidatus Clavichlamydia salmonicola TaxID=469812 RepID=UPI0018914374|nr:hypothetical protein [Candidatus Clavichlamydia salmonicola]MBF5051271.1 hypothetical protein [Candidatus Clavichlamydia salmonicola]
MLYFTLKYFGPLTPTDIQGFIITEEKEPLNATKILEISTLVQSVINTHAICLSVPTSFPLNPEVHSNTLFVLEDVMLTLKQQLEENEENTPIQHTMSSLYSYLLTDSGLDFQQPPPIPIDDLTKVFSIKTSQPKVSANEKRASFSNLFTVASKKCKPSYPYFNSFSNNTALQPETSCSTEQRSSKEYVKKNQSSPTSIEIRKSTSIYTLPIIELIPERDRFIITSLVISDVESYLELLHKNISLILKNELFFLDTIKDTKSRTFLSNQTFQTLLSLLHEQQVLIKSIPDLRRKEAIQSEHLILTDEIVIRLQAAGFSDNAIANMTASNTTYQLTEIHTEDCQQESPKHTQANPASEKLVNLISDTSSSTSTQSLSPPSTEDITLVLKNITYYVPLCFIKISRLYLKYFYTLVYQVKKNTTSLYDCYTNCRETISKLHTAVTKLCDKNNSKKFGLKHMCPITKKSTKIKKIELLQRLFIGIEENLEFLKNHHPKLLKPTQTYDPLADLENSLKLIKNKLKDNLPTTQPSDTLLKILQEAKKQDAPVHLPSTTKTLSPFINKKSPSLQNLIIKIKPYKTSPKTTPIIPIFSSSVKIVSSHTDTLNTTKDLCPEIPSMQDIELISKNITHYMPLCFIKITKTTPLTSNSSIKFCYTLVYQVKKNTTSLYDCYTNCRKTISALFTSITTLCGTDDAEKLGLHYISPISKKSKKVNTIEMLQHLFVGVQENLIFLKNHHPAFLRPTQIYDPFADLESSLKLLRNQLKDNLPTQQPSDILLKILEEAQKKDADLISAPTTKTVSPIIKKKSSLLQDIIPEIRSSDITFIIPVFCTSFKNFSSKKNNLEVGFCTLHYQTKATSGLLSKFLALLRKNIHRSTQDVESLLNPLSKEHRFVNFKYIAPFEKRSTLISRDQALLVLFEGLNENLNFLNTACPELFVPTKIYDSKTALEKALLLVKKALSTPLPTPKEPSILPALLADGRQTYLNTTSMEK